MKPENEPSYDKIKCHKEVFIVKYGDCLFFYKKGVINILKGIFNNLIKKTREELKF